MRDESSGRMLMRMPEAVGLSKGVADSSCLQARSEPPTAGKRLPLRHITGLIAMHKLERGKILYKPWYIVVQVKDFCLLDV